MITSKRDRKEINKKEGRDIELENLLVLLVFFIFMIMMNIIIIFLGFAKKKLLSMNLVGLHFSRCCKYCEANGLPIHLFVYYL